MNTKSAVAQTFKDWGAANPARRFLEAPAPDAQWGERTTNTGKTKKALGSAVVECWRACNPGFVIPDGLVGRLARLTGRFIDREDLYGNERIIRAGMNTVYLSRIYIDVFTASAGGNEPASKTVAAMMEKAFELLLEKKAWDAIHQAVLLCAQAGEWRVDVKYTHVVNRRSGGRGNLDRLAAAQTAAVANPAPAAVPHWQQVMEQQGGASVGSLSVASSAPKGPANEPLVPIIEGEVL